jgi:hypothetical protein
MGSSNPSTSDSRMARSALDCVADSIIENQFTYVCRHPPIVSTIIRYEYIPVSRSQMLDHVPSHIHGIKRASSGDASDLVYNGYISLSLPTVS